MSDDGSRLLASLSSCMGGWCEQRDNCARHTTAPRSVAHERICAKGQEIPEPVLDLATFADPVCPVAVMALETRRASLDARTRVFMAPTDGRQSKLQQKILSIVLKAGVTGIASSKIAAAASCNIETVSRHIRELRAAGLVEPSRKAGVSMRWGPPGTWAHHEAERGRASLEQRKRDRRKSDKEAAVSFSDRPIVRLLVKAADCQPMVKPGPSSVFELARWAA